MSENVDNEAKRHRSPNYPAVGLREAVERVRKLYAADGRAGAPAEIAARHIGFGSAHGTAMSVVSALKKFGLLSEAGGRLVPTKCAIEILNFPETDRRRKLALKEAAMNPDLYRELVEQHSETGWPNADVLEAELTADRGFNPRAVGGFVRDFFDTLDYAEILLQGKSEPAQAEASLEESSPASAGSEGAGETSFRPSEFSVNAGRNITRRYPLDISIPRSLKAELTISGEFRREDLARLKTQLGRLIENLEDAFAD